MKPTLILLALATSSMGAQVWKRNNGLHFDNDACDADNCARQVTGTRKGPAAVSTQSADCSSFMQVFIDPDGDAAPVTPTAVPTYASACKVGEYSSACSCWGFAVATVTADVDDWGRK